MSGRPDDSPSTATSYHYYPLDATINEVRLLKLSRPSPAATWSDISLSLVTVPLHDAPAFSAISYVWGDQTRVQHKLLDGMSVLLLETAVEAVQHMFTASFLESEDLTCFIWIDAVCINLSDRQERAQQVLLMSDIYSTAVQVLAFLGLSFNGHQEIMTGIAAAAEALRQAAGSRAQLDKLLDYDTALPVTDYLRDLPRASLAEFYSSPWFRRLWILQEAALAKTALAFYGKQNIPLTDAIMVARALVKVERHSGSFEINRDALSRGISRCKTLYNLRVWHACKLNLAHEGGCRKGLCYDGLPMTYLLEVTHSHANSEMRDKVYAVLGLAHTSVSQELQPNYDLPLQSVYIQATRTAFSQDKSYEIMRWARTCGNRPDSWYRDNNWPTWSPLWQDAYDRLKNPSGLPWWTFRASRNGAPKFLETDLTDPILRCQGVFLDVVDQVSELLLNGTAEEDGDLAIKKLAIAIQYALPRARTALGVHSGQTPLMALAATLAAGALQTSNESRLLVEAEDDLAGTANRLAEMTSVSLTRNAEGTGAGQSVKYLYHFKFHSCFRKIFFTRAGYMGLGSQHLQIGDLLFLPLGNSVPWILREEGDHYLFIGVCYVHGIMQGELADEMSQQNSKHQPQWVNIH
ncbi:Heterokaryon incompatibility protein 6, OR allele [Cercospora beticola]|uniref:Heterokaryon incompatibility protein 6, OR allele n=1 Tax=Cercospora beticola TaxID=122368 RepID=A0A2G5IBE5_CERBT|nr:Heterokaryon incompatibility protein 6, OR allele [Cercospora beticola]PIB02091.1 Heterokaryon incompatibility protein 6, OR allele [Cercospora beticola]WPA97736.1 hypothetical protein RHO25_002347 [Cercospora beticola]